MRMILKVILLTMLQYKQTSFFEQIIFEYQLRY